MILGCALAFAAIIATLTLGPVVGTTLSLAAVAVSWAELSQQRRQERAAIVILAVASIAAVIVFVRAMVP